MKVFIAICFLALLTTVLFYGISSFIPQNKNSKPPLYTQVFSTDNGYGYTIETKNKILIKQNYIPAIQGKKGFKTYKDAKLVANLVRNKIQKGISPNIAIKELIDLNIVILSK